ncbi:MAG: response regulator [Lachnospiraceae bacterium]|nr:response regulator [Lachnospiraceae bacterium]
MLFNESYNIYFELSVLPIELILLIFVYGNYKDDRNTKATNYRFKIYALLTTVGTLLDIVTGLTFMWGDTLPAWFHVVFLSINFLMGLCSSMGFYFYMIAFSGLQKNEHVLNVIAYIISSVYVIVLIINYFTGVAFEYIPGIGLVRNIFYGIVGYLFPLYFIALGVSLSFFRKKKFTKVQRTFLVSGFMIVLAIFILQIKLEERAQMAYFVSGICLLMLFLTLETPEYTELINTLDELDRVRKDERKALERIKRSDEAKSTFLSHLSHEIKTPINAIMGYTEEILKANVSDEVKENAASAFKGARRLDQFFTDIVDNMADITEFGNSALVSLEEIEKELYLNVGFDLDEKKNAKDFVSKSGFLAVNPSDSFPDSSMYRILCVDDNELNMELLVRTVKQFGFSVDGAEDGKTAIELVSKNDYDLILMDHMMPVMDGVEAMHYLRDNSLCDLTPIIVVTANAVRGEREKYVGEGFDSFLPKPFTGGSLLRALGKFLPLATMETLVKVNSKSGISGIMLASTFSRPLIAPGSKILIAGQDMDSINRLSRLFLTTMARIDVVYGCDECIERLSVGDYDIVFVEDGLRSNDNRTIKTYIWNSVDIPTILITRKNSDIDPAVIYDSYTDYISIDDDSDVIDAILLLYLPKDKVRVIGSLDEKKKFSMDIKSSYNLSDGVEDHKPERTEPEPVFDPDIEMNGELAFLAGVDGIDVHLGVYNCGSEEGLKKAIEIFVSTAEKKAGEINELYTAGDIDGYTIRVHALKSSSRIIGATELSELARALEAAGKDHNSDFINDKTQDLLSEYRAISKTLSDKLSVDEPVDKQPASPEIVKDAFSTIYELALMMDYDSIETIFDSLRRYEFEQNDAEKLDKIKKSMEALDWDMVLSCAKEAL